MADTAFDERLKTELDLAGRAWAYAGGKNPKLPDPESLMALYQPMKFRRKAVGKYYKIVTETSDTFNVTNERMHVLLGVRLLRVKYPEPVEFHLLQHKGRTLTSDKPIEIYQQYCSFVNMRGRCLVGGLGLGMAAQMIQANPAVTEVVVVEKCRTIIDLIQNGLHKKIRVIRADLFQYLRDVPAGQYDSAYFDIWYATGEDEWGRYVLPLYRQARRKGINVLGAWGEFEMNWQLRTALHRAAFQPDGVTFFPALLWRRGLKDHFKTKGAPATPDRVDEVEGLLELYLTGIGTAAWEKVFGRACDLLLET